MKSIDTEGFGDESNLIYITNIMIIDYYLWLLTYWFREIKQ